MNRDLVCHDENRRARLRAEGWNGFDYLEVEDLGKPAPGESCRVQLRIYLLSKNDELGGALDVCQFAITGGRRVPRVSVQEAEYLTAPHGEDDTILLSVERPNDLSTYTLRLVRPTHPDPDAADLLEWFDPRYTTLAFSFAAGCPSDLDGPRPAICPPAPLAEPPIDYLARDYSALRRLLLDRLALILPEWKRRAVPDLGVALVELLAYTGDRISYYQDAIATEAYLGTARKRISLRRHARLVDYLMHEGCNARAFVCLRVSQDELSVDPAKLSLLTSRPVPHVTKGRTRSTLTPADPLAGRETFLPICPPHTLELSLRDIYDWRELVILARSMPLSPEPTASTAVKKTAQSKAAKQKKPKHQPTLEKTWPMLKPERQKQLERDGFNPTRPRLQSAYEGWIKEHSPWHRLSDAERQTLSVSPFDPFSATWTEDSTEADKWNAFEQLWPKLPAALQKTLSDQGLTPNALALVALTERWFQLQRIGLRLSAALQERLLGEPHPDDPALQSALVAELNRALHDRGLAQTGTITTDAEVLRSNRDFFQDLFGETLAPPGQLQLYTVQNELHFYTWGDTQCCLPRGTTRATLRASSPLRLRIGDVLIFEEILGPTTGLPGDANPAHRHPVQLTRVAPAEDVLWGLKLVEIEWAAEDALPFPLCLSVRGPADGGNPCVLLENVSVARGNVLLVDHGHRIEAEPIGKVPLETLAPSCRCDDTLADPVIHAGSFTPRLARTDLVFAEAPRLLTSARQALQRDPRRALPSVTLTSIAGGPDGESPLFTWRERADVTLLADRVRPALAAAPGLLPGTPVDLRAWKLLGRLSAALRTELKDDKNDPRAVLEEVLAPFLAEWIPRFDLLGSEAEQRHFVVEMDETRVAHLRFGFDGMGQTPEAGAIFAARYRIGNPLAGNVGADRITEVSLPRTTARNPLPSSGGTAPESPEEVRRKAPFVFHRALERAITAEDYTQLAMKCPHAPIQRAGTDLRWTGTRHLARVAIDPLGGEVAPAALLAGIKAWLEPRRRIGHEVEVVPAILVPLRITLRVCVLPHHQPAHVKQALLEVFGCGLQANGARGYFHPDELTFGVPIRLSALAAAAQAVTGVASVQVRELQRLFSPPNHELENGLLPLGPLEIAQLQNDPTFPEHGVLTIELGGAQS